MSRQVGQLRMKTFGTRRLFCTHILKLSKASSIHTFKTPWHGNEQVLVHHLGTIITFTALPASQHGRFASTRKGCSESMTQCLSMLHAHKSSLIDRLIT